VLGHDHVADHHKSIFLPCTVQNAQQEITALAGSQLGPPLSAALLRSQHRLQLLYAEVSIAKDGSQNFGVKESWQRGTEP
jgi:hypothetical protein